MNVDPGIARWLKEGVIFASAEDAAIVASWAGLARSSDTFSPFATKAGAEAEAARQLAFLKGPLVLDEHLVAGSRFDLIGCPVTITGDWLGYAAGAVVFVVGAAEVEDVDETRLTVVRRLS